MMTFLLPHAPPPLGNLWEQLKDDSLTLDPPGTGDLVPPRRHPPCCHPHQQPIASPQGPVCRKQAMGQVNWRLQAAGAPGPWETCTSAPSTRPLWNWNPRPPQLLPAPLCTSVPAPSQWRWLELCPTSAPAFSWTEVPASCPYRAHLKGHGRKTLPVSYATQPAC